MAEAGTKPRTNGSGWLLPVVWTSHFPIRALRNSVHKAGDGATVGLGHWADWTTFTAAEPMTGKRGSHFMKRKR